MHHGYLSVGRTRTISLERLVFVNVERVSLPLSRGLLAEMNTLLQLNATRECQRDRACLPRERLAWRSSNSYYTGYVGI